MSLPHARLELAETILEFTVVHERPPRITEIQGLEQMFLPIHQPHGYNIFVYDSLVRSIRAARAETGKPTY